VGGQALVPVLQVQAKEKGLFSLQKKNASNAL